MKKFVFVLMAAASSLAFVNCSGDDDSGSQDCFDCSLMGVNTEYCYTEGEDHYTMTVMGQSEDIPLNGASWADVKEGLQSICN